MNVGILRRSKALLTFAIVAVVVFAYASDSRAQEKCA